MKATHRVCADGGANRWFDIASKLPRATSSTDARELLPDIICGDLDSLRDDVRQFYEQRGVRVDDLSEDQDTTDLTKSVNYINRKLNERGNCEDVIIVAAGVCPLCAWSWKIVKAQIHVTQTQIRILPYY